MNELKMPMPKIPELETPAEYVVEEEEFEPETEPEENEGFQRLAKVAAKLIAFVSVLGLPAELKKGKMLEYEDLAYDTGLADAVIDVLEYYMPSLEDRPEYALLFALAMYLTYVMIDRQQTLAEYKKRHPPDAKKSKQMAKALKQKSEEIEMRKREEELEKIREFNKGGEVNGKKQ